MKYDELYTKTAHIKAVWRYLRGHVISELQAQDTPAHVKVASEDLPPSIAEVPADTIADIAQRLEVLELECDKMMNDYSMIAVKKDGKQQREPDPVPVPATTKRPRKQARKAAK